MTPVKLESLQEQKKEKEILMNFQKTKNYRDRIKLAERKKQKKEADKLRYLERKKDRVMMLQANILKSQKKINQNQQTVNLPW